MPTGYPVTKDEWISAGAMIARMNFALDLVEGRVNGIQVRLGDVIGEEARAALVAGKGEEAVAGLEAIQPLLAALTSRVLAGAVDSDLEEAIADAHAEVPPGDVQVVLRSALGIVLGSPAFQRY